MTRKRTTKNKTKTKNKNKTVKSGVISNNKITNSKPSDSLMLTSAMNQLAVGKSPLQSLCGLTNPFCADARGTKYPDSSGVSSLAYTNHFKINMTTNAAGSAATMFFPSYGYPTATGTLVGSAVTYAALTVALGTGLNPNAFRFISMGVRIKSVLAPLNASGMVRIRGFPSKVGSALTAVDTTTYYSDFSADIPVSCINNNGYTDVVLKRLDITSQNYLPQTYINPTANVTDWQSPGWGVVQIAVDGGPVSTLVLDCECFYHFEMTFADNDNLQLLATPAAKSNNMLTQAASHISEVAGNVFTEVKRDVETVITGLARKAMVDFAKGALTRAPMLALM